MDPYGGGAGTPVGGFGGLPFPDGSMPPMPMPLPMPPLPMPMPGMMGLGGMGHFDPNMAMQMGAFSPMGGAPFMQQQMPFGGMQPQHHQQQHQQQQPQQQQQQPHDDQVYDDLPAPTYEH